MEFKSFLGWIYDAADGIETGSKAKKVTSIPVAAAKPLIWLGEKVGKITGKRPLLTVKDLGDSVSQRWFGNGRARDVLGYIPEIDLKTGVREAVEGYEKALTGKKE